MKPRLENWSVTEKPGWGFKCLYGQVYGHPICREGSFVWTNELLEIDEEALTARTASREYTLGSRADVVVRQVAG